MAVSPTCHVWVLGHGFRALQEESYLGPPRVPTFAILHKNDRCRDRTGISSLRGEVTYSTPCRWHSPSGGGSGSLRSRTYSPFGLGTWRGVSLVEAAKMSYSGGVHDIPSASASMHKASCSWSFEVPSKASLARCIAASRL